MPKDPRWSDFTRRANLRAAFDLWPPGRPMPTTADDVAKAALGLTVGDVFAGRGAPLMVLRFARDDVSMWLLDALAGVSIEDFVRAVARRYEPHAYAMAVVRPMWAAPDPTVRGVTCRAVCGDDLVEVTGRVQGADGPPDERALVDFEARAARLTEPKTRWIGVPPTVDVDLPMLDAGEA